MNIHHWVIVNVWWILAIVGIVGIVAGIIGGWVSAAGAAFMAFWWSLAASFWIWVIAIAAHFIQRYW